MLEQEREEEAERSKGRGGPMGMGGSSTKTSKPKPVHETVQVEHQVQEPRAMEGASGKGGAQAKQGGYHLWPDWGPC